MICVSPSLLWPHQKKITFTLRKTWSRLNHVNKMSAAFTKCLPHLHALTRVLFPLGKFLEGNTQPCESSMISKLIQICSALAFLRFLQRYGKKPIFHVKIPLEKDQILTLIFTKSRLRGKGKPCQSRIFQFLLTSYI